MKEKVFCWCLDVCQQTVIKTKFLLISHFTYKKSLILFFLSFLSPPKKVGKMLKGLKNVNVQSVNAEFLLLLYPERGPLFEFSICPHTLCVSIYLSIYLSIYYLNSLSLYLSISISIYQSYYSLNLFITFHHWEKERERNNWYWRFLCHKIIANNQVSLMQ